MHVRPGVRGPGKEDQMKKKENTAFIAAVVFIVMVAVILVFNATAGGGFESSFLALALITKEAYSSLFLGVV